VGRSAEAGTPPGRGDSLDRAQYRFQIGLVTGKKAPISFETDI
jgi:hypothetical protein